MKKPEVEDRETDSKLGKLLSHRIKSSGWQETLYKLA
jgi:hypothetical protein